MASALDNEDQLLKVLKTLKKGGEVSRHYKMELVKRGLMEITTFKRVLGRGRPAFSYTLTTKGLKMASRSKVMDRLDDLRKRIDELYNELSQELISDNMAADEFPNFEGDEAH